LHHVHEMEYSEPYSFEIIYMTGRDLCMATNPYAKRDLLYVKRDLLQGNTTLHTSVGKGPCAVPFFCTSYVTSPLTQTNTRSRHTLPPPLHFPPPPPPPPHPTGKRTLNRASRQVFITQTDYRHCRHRGGGHGRRYGHAPLLCAPSVGPNLAG